MGLIPFYWVTGEPIYFLNATHSQLRAMVDLPVLEAHNEMF
jgi:hypothetical protein